MLPGGQVSAAPLETLPEVTAPGTVTWLVDLEAGASFPPCFSSDASPGFNPSMAALRRCAQELKQHAVLTDLASKRRPGHHLLSSR